MADNIFNFKVSDVPAEKVFEAQRKSFMLKPGESLTVQGESFVVPDGYDFDCVVEIHGNLIPVA